MYNVSSKYLAASTNTVREVGLRGIIRYKDERKEVPYERQERQSVLW